MWSGRAGDVCGSCFPQKYKECNRKENPGCWLIPGNAPVSTAGSGPGSRQGQVDDPTSISRTSAGPPIAEIIPSSSQRSVRTYNQGDAVAIPRANTFPPNTGERSGPAPYYTPQGHVVPYTHQGATSSPMQEGPAVLPMRQKPDGNPAVAEYMSHFEDMLRKAKEDIQQAEQTSQTGMQESRPASPGSRRSRSREPSQNRETSQLSSNFRAPRGCAASFGQAERRPPAYSHRSGPTTAIDPALADTRNFAYALSGTESVELVPAQPGVRAGFIDQDLSSESSSSVPSTRESSRNRGRPGDGSASSPSASRTHSRASDGSGREPHGRSTSADSGGDMRRIAHAVDRLSLNDESGARRPTRPSTADSYGPYDLKSSSSSNSNKTKTAKNPKKGSSGKKNVG